MPFVDGETVGPYRIMDQLGQGGMATVFKAYHPALDRYVAIKAMHPVFMEDPSFLARFQREAQVVARLDHPNIVPIYDFSEHEGRPYLVMRYIDGETLKARLRRGALRASETTTIVRAVAEALFYAHSQGVLHRDIKPSNVLQADEGKTYLADFGLARMAQAGQSTLSSDVMLGTPQYISPEQARGNMDLDEGTDIYSFGVMLYEIVTGQVPFTADTPYSIIHDHIYSPLPAPRTINPDIGPEVERVLLKALAKERQDRFENVEALGAAFLEAWETDQSSAALAKVDFAAPDLIASYDPTLPPGASQASLGAAPLERTDDLIEDTDSLPPGAVDSQSRLAAEIRGKLQGDVPHQARSMKSRRRRWRWWYLAPLTLLFCMCGFVGLAAWGGMAKAGAAGGPIQTEVIPGIDANPGRDVYPALGSQPSGPDSDRPPDGGPLQAAEHRIDGNPEEPMAYLELARVYIDMGNLGAAQTTLDEGAQLAAAENPTYYLEAASMLSDHEYWLPAAEMYFKLAQASPGELAPGVRHQAEMAVYLAANQPGARQLLNLLEEREALELPLLDTLQARFQLYQGRPEMAQNIVDRILETEPGFAPGQLLQAEILINNGNLGSAEEILETLANQDAAQPWVPAIAEYMLGELIAVK